MRPGCQILPGGTFWALCVLASKRKARWRRQFSWQLNYLEAWGIKLEDTSRRASWRGIPYIAGESRSVSYGFPL